MLGPEITTCWLKIGRAEEHFNSIKHELTEWTNSRPYTLIKDPGVDGSHHQLIVKIKSPDPFDRLALIAGDCVQNLRSALDHLVYALAVRDAGTNPPPNVKSLQFPICSCPEEFVAQSKRRLINVSAKTRGFVERFQPYHRRHTNYPNLLEVLGDFNNIDKHRLLQVAFSHIVLGEIKFTSPLPGTSQVHWLKTPVKDGMPCALITLSVPQTDFQYTYNVTIEVTIAHLPSESGLHISSLADLMHRLIAAVKEVLNEAMVL